VKEMSYYRKMLMETGFYSEEEIAKMTDEDCEAEYIEISTDWASVEAN
jgi:hypothetical protein